ncbi:DUF6185 family protein [Streptomyces sp. NPDC000151]|uniref:DUF6185 family protein n=1 Tax=Streptomyces sp. NPDC000151 TaxID=3154244 RepID=UPI0033297AA8
MCAVLLPEPAYAAPKDGCAAGSLTKADVTASLRMTHGGREQTRVTSRLTVRVPLSWPRARDLLLSEDSDAYRAAMRCLLRPGDGRQINQVNEWRPPDSPEAVPVKDGVRVVFDAYTWIDDRSSFEPGPWRIEVGHARWRVRLDPPAALKKAHWRRIEVDPGEPGALQVSPRITKGKDSTALIWEPSAKKPVPEVSVRLAPDWVRSWSAQANKLPFSNLDRSGYLLHELLIAVLALYLARAARRHAPPAGDEAAASRTLLQWSVLAAVVVLVIHGDEIVFQTLQEYRPGLDWFSLRTMSGMLTCLALGWLLLAFGRVPAPFVHAAGIAAAGALPYALGVWTPGSWEALLPAGIAGGACVFTAVLGGFAAARRLAADGGLYVPSRPRPRLRTVAPWAAVTALVAVGCYVWTSERQWRRTSWPSDHSDPRYGVRHADFLGDNLAWFADYAQDWLFGWALLLTLIGLLGVLRARALRSGAPARGPEGVEYRLVLLLFAAGAGLFLGVFAYDAVLSPLWIALNAVALHLLLEAGRSRAVLCQRLEASGTPLAEAVTEAGRTRLMDDSRRHREIHAKLRRLDQGQSDDGAHTRRGFERDLKGLHRLRTPSGKTDRLPPKISVVDVALAWGPRDTWWANGVRTASFAAVLGIPASGFLVWVDSVSGEAWTRTLYWGFGLPNLVVSAVYWEVVWGCLGFALGTLWRLLPGRRGPAKALPIALAYALPGGVDAVGNQLLDQGQGNLVLYLVCALLVLTLTGAAVDLDTFKGERRYWNSRYSLLLSVYQMRYFSIQVAYVVAQIVALITVWEFLSDGGGAPSKELGKP